VHAPLKRQRSRRRSKSKSLQLGLGAAVCERDLHHTRLLRLARSRCAELTLDRHDLRTRQALVEAEELLDGLRNGPHQSYGPRGRALRTVQCAWSTESHSVGPAKRDAAMAGPTFLQARGRVEACSTAPDASGVAAPAPVRSAVVRITADPSSSGSTRGRVSDISCCNARVLATFLSTYRYGTVDAHRCRQARGVSTAQTWWNCACSRAS
jgi:hypothetical protein